MKAPAAFQSLAVYNTTLRRTSTAARKLIVPTIARLSPFFRRRINFRVLLKLFTPLLVADLLYSVTRFRQIIKTNITCGTKSRLARAVSESAFYQFSQHPHWFCSVRRGIAFGCDTVRAVVNIMRYEKNTWCDKQPNNTLRLDLPLRRLVCVCAMKINFIAEHSVQSLRITNTGITVNPCQRYMHK